MTPKAQQIANYELLNNNNSSNDGHPMEEAEKNKANNSTNHQRSPSTSSSICSSSEIVAVNSKTSAFFYYILYNFSYRISNVINPSIIFLIATSIALKYPLLQLVMFLTILVGTSPLYFILITFIGKSDKHNYDNYYCKLNHQHHRKQPSIVGSISGEMSGIDNKTIR